jgi:hypothetical protein
MATLNDHRAIRKDGKRYRIVITTGMNRGSTQEGPKGRGFWDTLEDAKAFCRGADFTMDASSLDYEL